MRIPIPDPDDFRYKKKNPHLREREKQKLVCDALVSATEKQRLGTIQIDVVSQNDFNFFYRRELLTILETLSRQNPIAFSVPKENYGKEEIPEEEREATLVDEHTAWSPRPPAYREAPLPEKTPIKLTLFENFDNWRAAYLFKTSRTLEDLDQKHILSIRELISELWQDFQVRANSKIQICNVDENRLYALDYLQDEGILTYNEAFGHAADVFIEVEKFQKLRAQLLGILNKNNETIRNFTYPSNLSWNEITIRFHNGNDVSVEYRNEKKELDYKKLGFADTKGKKPNKQWELLRSLAECNGRITWDDEASDPRLQKRKELLCKALRKEFRIASDPIVPLKGKKKGYESKINLIPD